MDPFFLLMTAALFCGILLFTAFAYYTKIFPTPLKSNSSSASIEAAIFALLGLLIAFNYGGAYSRFETRRQILVDEANAIGTARLRLDLLKPSEKELLDRQFQKYIDLRANFFPLLTDEEAAKANLFETKQLQKEIWTLAVQSTEHPEGFQTRMLLLPALNQMFDIVTTRTLAVINHTPYLILVTFLVISLTCAILIGLKMQRDGHFSLFYASLFSLVISIALYMSLDLEYPRFGLITLEPAHQFLRDIDSGGT